MVASDPGFTPPFTSPGIPIVCQEVPPFSERKNPLTFPAVIRLL